MKKNLIIIALFLVCGLSLYTCFEFYQEDKNQQKRYAELLQTSGKTEIIKEYIRDSIPHVVYREKFVRDKATEKRLAISNSYADSLEQALKLSINKINQVTKVNAQLDAQLKMAIEDNAISYQDKFLKIQYYPISEKLQLQYNMGLNIARYSKKQWLFGKRQHYIDVFADDPRVNIKGLNTYTIEEKSPNRFGLGLHTGYGFILHENKIHAEPYFGIGLNYNLIQF